MKSKSTLNSRRNLMWISPGVLALMFFSACATAVVEPGPGPDVGSNLCSGKTVTANVVAINQPITMNRFGASIPGGMMFALKRDVCKPNGTNTDCVSGAPSPGHAMLRPDKRPRPMVLRVNEGQCLQVNFTNLLDPNGNVNNKHLIFGGGTNTNPTTTSAGVHTQGLNWVDSSSDDGSYVGNNPSSLASAVAPGNQRTYTLYAEHEGQYVLYSTADDYTKVSPGDGGSLAEGLFGAVIVEPAGSEWYRSQVTYAELQGAGGNFGSDAYPTNINYSKLAMLDSKNEIIHSDLTAIITGPKAGHFPDPGDLGKRSPEFRPSYVYPNRTQPYREFTIIYHETFMVNQAFPFYYQGNGGGAGPGTKGLPTISEVGDNFGINYAFNGLGSPILANRLGVGALAQCTDCKYEEFFLSAWTAGDPAMIVNNPITDCISTTNGQKQSCDATGDQSKLTTKALYPDDPSNVYHSYISDHLKFRILHGGNDLHHLHHQHAHQWLASPSSPKGDYLDSQSIGPGSGFTLEYVYSGSGNVNQVVGDSIFHCHFYPHFASGMWGLWRTHDVFEAGTELGKCPDGTSGCPTSASRALPDAEIALGTPIPAIVPLPGLPMAPLPAPVKVASNGKLPGSQVSVGLVTKPTKPTDPSIKWVSPVTDDSPYDPLDPPLKPYLNPGFPFFVAGIAGSRAPHPPLDFAYACADGTVAELIVDFKDNPTCTRPDGKTCDCEPLDGGLARHIMDPTVQDPSQADASTSYLDPTAVSTASGNPTAVQPFAQVDYSKKIVKAGAQQLDPSGTLVERIAMGAHAQRDHPSQTPGGDPGDFILNGLPPVPGAPYANPCIDLDGQPAQTAAASTNYLAADIQLDAVFNKAGWHFPQQRILSLWGDVEATLNGTRAPEPMFLRVNSYDCMNYTYANLVPNVYELDDFQVRTPTDIIGQHIHLVKFDVTSSDGAANGWNYEDGTFGPNEVTERINAIRAANDCKGGSPTSFDCPEAKPIKFFGEGPGGSWLGAQATVQRWYDDPLLDNFGICSTEPTKTCRTSDPTSCVGGECLTSGGFCSNDANKVCSVGDSNCGATGICIPAYDRTIRTIFTHDHFSPSTHQQTGLYAGVVVEPRGSQWFDNANEELMGGFDPLTGQNFQGNRDATYGDTGVTVRDGGPTSWQAVITAPSLSSPGVEQLSYREFLLEFQDSAPMYQPFAVAPGIGYCSQSLTTACSTDSDCTGKGVCYETIGSCTSDATKACLADSDCGGVAGSCQASSTPVGFCSNTGVCVDTAGTATGTACLVNPQSGLSLWCSNDNTQTCTTLNAACTPSSAGTCVQVPSTCASGDVCMLQSAYLRACSPDDPDLAQTCGGNLTQQCDGAPCPQSCNFVTGVPSTSWTLTAATQNVTNNPVSNLATVPGTGVGEFIDFHYKGVETITFQNSTDNFSVNYRNEPFYPRMTDSTGAVLGGAYGDLGFVYSSKKFCTGNYTECENDKDCGGAVGSCAERPKTNLSGTYPIVHYPFQAGAEDNDPFTPLMRAYAGDDVQIRTLVGAHINPHNFTLHGMNWTMEPSFVDSGWRNSQVMGISEHFELLLKVPPKFDGGSGGESADYLYKVGAADVEQASGNWGLLRAYDTLQSGLATLPQNKTPQAINDFCVGKSTVSFTVVAVATPVTYNKTAVAADDTIDANGVVFVNSDDSNLTCPGDPSTCTYTGSNPVPLVLRAPAGDCISVTLYNNLTTATTAGVDFTPIPSKKSTSKLATNISQYLGLRPQLVAYDPTVSDGTNAGLNPIQTVGPGQNNKAKPYLWYAGNLDPKASGADQYIPIEFGTANLLPTDPLNHPVHETFAGLVIEPQNSKPANGKDWSDPSNTGPVATITTGGTTFRDFAIFFQDSTNLQASPAGNQNSTNLVNFRTESLNVNTNPSRYCENCPTTDYSCVFTSDSYTIPSGGSCTKTPFTPQTPIFEACTGEQVRFRVFHPGGTNTNQVFELYGHGFSEAPYMTAAEYCQGPNPATAANLVSTNLYQGLSQTNLHASSTIGAESQCLSTEWLAQYPPATGGLWAESLNDWKGSRMGIGPSNHFDAFIDSAGGCNQVHGDYLYRSYPAFHFNLGAWGLFRVCERDSYGNPEADCDATTLTSCLPAVETVCSK